MPDPTPQPAQAPASAPDLSQQLAALTDAMRQLAESQKTLVEAMKPVPAPSPAPAQPSPPAPVANISGDPSGGASPGALASIDYSKLSPLQQITLGLRDARPANSPRAGAD